MTPVQDRIKSSDARTEPTAADVELESQIPRGQSRSQPSAVKRKWEEPKIYFGFGSLISLSRRPMAMVTKPDDIHKCHLGCHYLFLSQWHLHQKWEH